MARASQIQRAEVRRLLKLPQGVFEPIDLNVWPHPEWMTRAFRNNRYTVMINDNCPTSQGNAIRAMVQRHDDLPIPNHWREMQKIKNVIFGTEALAIEYYPPESKLVDLKNIYWLWVFPDGVIPTAVLPRDQ